MSSDLEEQEDELLALDSIFDAEEFVREGSASAGEVRVSVELPPQFTVALREGETLREDEISYLPPLRLTFDLPDNYPSSSPPSFSLTCSWLTPTQLSALSAQLLELYRATGGAVVLFTWIQFLREEALECLGLHTRLEIPSDEPEPGKSAPLDPESDPNPPTDDRTSDLPQQNESISGQEAPDSGTNEESISPNTSNGFNKVTQASGETEAEEMLQDSHAKDQSESQTSDIGSGPTLTRSQTLLSELLIHDAVQRQKMFKSTVYDCGVCFAGVLGSDCVQLPECGHVFCRACILGFCTMQITEGNVLGVKCLEADCSASPTPAQVRSLVGEELFSRYDRLLLQKTLDLMSDVVYCPRRSCGSAIIQDKSSSAAMCPACNFAFCVTCKKTYHGQNDCLASSGLDKPTPKGTKPQKFFIPLPKSEEGLKALWEDYTSGSKQRKELLESRYSRERLLFVIEEGLSEGWIAVNCKNCPHCFSRIQKDMGCNKMTCSRCGRLFCWVCLEKLHQKNIGPHFQEGGCVLFVYTEYP